jgi:hypothetical protein
MYHIEPQDVSHSIKTYNIEYYKYKQKYLDSKQKYHGGDRNKEESARLITAPFDLIDSVFPTKPGLNKKDLHFTNISVYSVDSDENSIKLAKIIKKHAGKDIVVTDMTANVGASTIRLGMEFKQVNAIELDPLTCNALKHNIKLYGLDNVNVICGDSTIEIKKLKSDVIFMDPPWGGPSYKGLKTMGMDLSGIDVADIVLANMTNTKLWCIRLPKNYEFNNFFFKRLPYEYTIYNILKYGKIRYYIMMLTPQTVT